MTATLARRSWVLILALLPLAPLAANDEVASEQAPGETATWSASWAWPLHEALYREIDRLDAPLPRDRDEAIERLNRLDPSLLLDPGGGALLVDVEVTTELVQGRVYGAPGVAPTIQEVLQRDLSIELWSRGRDGLVNTDDDIQAASISRPLPRADAVDPALLSRPGQGVLVGLARDSETRESVVGAAIEVTGPNILGTRPGHSDELGLFDFTLPPGEYWILLRVEGYHLSSARVVVRAQEATRAEVGLQRPGGCR